MPALVHVPGVARIVVKGLLGAGNVANVMHVYKGSGTSWTQSELDTVTAGVRSAYVSRFLPLLGTTFSLKDVEGQDLTSEVGLFSTTTGSSAGAIGGVAMPAQVALCVSWKVAAHFRGGHARTYFGGLAVTDASNSTTWSGTVVTAWTTAANQFITSVNALGSPAFAQFVMLSRYQGKDSITGEPTPRVTPLIRPILSAVVDTRIDTQRRRLGKDR